MEQAKAAIQDLTSDSGRRDTTVTEHVNPAVTAETVHPTQHQQSTKVIDREVHQDHYHTTVQPIADTEVLPEKHTHTQAPTEHREFRHDDTDKTKERLDLEAAKYKNTTTTAPTQVTQSANPTVTGEHHHHHVHEVIQPIVQKETVQPSVVHTTVPVHEVHHNEPRHHATSALPPVSMTDFKAQGGTLTGREDRTERFDGEPRTDEAREGGANLGYGSRSDRGHLDGDNVASRTDTDRRVAGDTHAAPAASSTTTATRDHTERDTATADSHDRQRDGSDRFDSGDSTRESGSTGAVQGKKPSLLDKLNPKKDADGDGKAGFMS